MPSPFLRSTAGDNRVPDAPAAGLAGGAGERDGGRPGLELLGRHLGQDGVAVRVLPVEPHLGERRRLVRNCRIVYGGFLRPPALVLLELLEFLLQPALAADDELDRALLRLLAGADIFQTWLGLPENTAPSRVLGEEVSGLRLDSLSPWLPRGRPRP